MTRKPQEPDAAELLDLLIEKAPELRKVGVLKVAIAGLSADLAPVQRATPKTEPAPKPRQPVDALNDPATFGLAEGAALPGQTQE